MRGSLGARAYYQAPRSRGIGHQAALRQPGNRSELLTRALAVAQDAAWRNKRRALARALANGPPAGRAWACSRAYIYGLGWRVEDPLLPLTGRDAMSSAVRRYRGSRLPPCDR